MFVNILTTLGKESTGRGYLLVPRWVLVNGGRGGGIHIIGGGVVGTC